MPGHSLALPLLLLLGLHLGASQDLPPPCDSEIYCYGPLLHAVQMAKFYPDDKQFVDMPMTLPPGQVLQKFNNLSTAHNSSIPREQLQNFVKTYFKAKGQELEVWTPEDWKESPKILQRISDPKLRTWAEKLNQLWKKLGRKVKAEVLKEPERFSLIPSRHPFIVPGGRFLEFYYCLGHIPNGARVYYKQRSQPPLLTLMMDSYFKHTRDETFLRDNIDTLASELDFWATNRSISVSAGGKNYILSRYYVPYGGPRPESYSKDFELASTKPEGERENLYTELKAGAESGWDFSSRWFVGKLSKPNSLSGIRTSRLVPVDLNAILCQAEALMSQFYATLGNKTQAQKYQDQRAQRMEAMQALMWDQQRGAWFDYDLDEKQKNPEFYPSNLAPLWAGCFQDSKVVDQVLKYLEDNKILNYKHGIPASLKDSGEQWDLPNAWAPLQDMVIRGLANSNSKRAKEVAFQLAQNWIKTNYDVFSRTSAMYEKYNITNGGQPGGGGEYEVQEGFGWTNGMAFMLLDRYGQQLTSGSQTVLVQPLCLVAGLLSTLLLSFLSQ
ncbi:trehalase isoform X2 [Sorex araneus]|uniref:trehalase isoform X2 n=1 Tax=Sorex araneus TaxID=42254 RepID=UPI0024336115|nr:trehalase isoform X2 [Sorex araneus]